jgi:Prophage CP4-57 regulatory protein (AlpA)
VRDHPLVFVTFDQLPAYGVPKFSRVHLYRLMRKGQFPQQVQITPNRVGWKRDSILGWVASRPLSSKVVPEASDAAD